MVDWFGALQAGEDVKEVVMEVAGMPDANRIEVVRNVMSCRRCVLFSWMQLYCSHSNQTGTWTNPMCCFLEMAVGSGARLWVCLWLAKQRLSEILGRTKRYENPSHFSAQLQISKGWDPLCKPWTYVPLRGLGGRVFSLNSCKEGHLNAKSTLHKSPLRRRW